MTVGFLASSEQWRGVPSPSGGARLRKGSGQFSGLQEEAGAHPSLGTQAPGTCS